MKTKMKLSKLDNAIVTRLKSTMQDYINCPDDYDGDEIKEILKLYKSSLKKVQPNGEYSQKNHNEVFCKALLIRWLKKFDLYPFNKICEDNFWDALTTLMEVAFEQINWDLVGESLAAQIQKFISALEKELANL